MNAAYTEKRSKILKSNMMMGENLTLMGNWDLILGLLRCDSFEKHFSQPLSHSYLPDVLISHQWAYFNGLECISWDMRNFRGNKKRVMLGRYPSRVEFRSKSFDWPLFEKFWPCKSIVDAALGFGTWRPTNHRKIRQSKRHIQIALSFLLEMAGLQNEKEIRSISICIDMSVLASSRN